MEIVFGFLGIVMVVSGALYGGFNAFSSPDTLPFFRRWLIFLCFASFGLGVLLIDDVSAKLGAPLLLGFAWLLWPGFEKEGPLKWSVRRITTVLSVVGMISFVGGWIITDVDGCENLGPVYMIVGGFLLFLPLMNLFDAIKRRFWH